jgi:hypothetical protein
VSAEDAHRSLDVLRTEGQRAVEIGQVVAGHGQVRVQ